MGPNLFFPELGVGGQNDMSREILSAARRVCNSCPVEERCLEFAIQNGIQDGMWGGRTRAERKELRRRYLLLDRTA